MKLPSVPLVVLDTETTGLLPRVNRIIEFASVRIEDGKAQEPYEQLFSIPDSVPPAVEMLTRINDKDLEGKPSMEELRDDVLKHIGDDTIIVGQNIGFDIRMLKGEGIDLTDRPWFDTSMLASLVFPEFASYSLGYMSQVLDLHHEPVHRALGDVNATIELLCKCWERLCALPESDLKPLREVMQKAPEGYRKLFDVLPESNAENRPTWLCMPEIAHSKATDTDTTVQFAKPEKGSVQLLDEPLSQHFLQTVVNGVDQHASDMHWIAVKNLHSTVRQLHIPKSVHIAHPTFSVLNPEAKDQLLSQESFTADEATLAVKLHWYDPTHYDDMPVHGDEKSIWYGTLACTNTSKAYTDQFQLDSGIVLIDHKQLLEILSNADHPGRAMLHEDAHVVIDDASMLEDTATKSYGWYCALESLRAAAENHEGLTRFTDVLQLWIEKTRDFQDVRYIVPSDLKTPESRGLREQLETLLEDDLLQSKELVQKQLRDLAKILDAENLPHRICWIEQRQNGSQFLESVPERIGDLLKEHLYDTYSTTLLIPPGSDSSLNEILPPGLQTIAGPSTRYLTLQMPIEFSGERTADDVLADPPEGKTVLLVGSRTRIEDIFVRYTKDLEERGITLICQGFGGGSGRMQAEFSAAEGSAVWVITPWIFETVELPFETIDHLLLDALPFDHPAHTVLSKRCEHYRNAFMEYSLPRLLHRLYRILRTFCRYKSQEGEVLFLDKRIEQKRYGKDIWKYISYLKNEEGSSQQEDQLTMF